MKRRKCLALLLTAAMLAAMLAGCASGTGSAAQSGSGGGQPASTAAQTGAQAGSQTEEQSGQTDAVADFSYPMDGSVTLKINMDPYDLDEIPDYVGDNYYFLRLQEEVGVQLEMIGSTSGGVDTTEDFLLLLASGDYPDIFQCNWISFPGGPITAIADGYIQPLDPYADCLPNFMSFLAEHPSVDQAVHTDNGDLFIVPWIREDGTEVETGLVVRKDWLDELNLTLPTTVDKMHDTLASFKENKNAAAPLTFELRWLWLETAAASLSNPYGVTYPFFVEDGTVRFGPMEAGYRDFVTMLAAWYKEGLLDADLASVDKATVQAKFANSEAGVAIQQANNVRNCIDSLASVDPSTEVAAVPSLVMNDGDKPIFSHYRLPVDGGYSLSMSAQTKHPEVVARFLDYQFSPDGIILNTYGTEGVSFNADANGEFESFTDTVLNPPNGDGQSTARKYFAWYYNWGELGRLMDYFDKDDIKVVKATWAADMGSRAMPPITHTAEENTVIAAKYSTLDTYCRESITKFILGTTPMDQWDAFVEEMKSLGIEEILTIKQTAYERYISR